MVHGLSNAPLKVEVTQMFVTVFLTGSVNVPVCQLFLKSFLLFLYFPLQRRPNHQSLWSEPGCGPRAENEGHPQSS